MKPQRLITWFKRNSGQQLLSQLTQLLIALFYLLGQQSIQKRMEKSYELKIVILIPILTLIALNLKSQVIKNAEIEKPSENPRRSVNSSGQHITWNKLYRMVKP